MGHAQGGQQPITGAVIQLWQVNTKADGGLGTAMLSGTVTSSDGSGNASNSNANAGNANNSLPAGYFTIVNAYTCPQGDALVYITASGGNPGLAAGTNNPQSQMVTALGSCNNLKSNVKFINISELTTVATVASLYPFMSGYNSIGASAAHFADMTAAFPLMNEYVDIQAGTAPGPALPAGYSGSTGDLNLEANVLAACVNSAGGTYNDGSVCGTLFNAASASSTSPSTDITAAALYIREHYTSYAGSISSLAAPQAPFQPSSTTSPPDWTLPIFQLPSVPTFSLAPGTYSGAQQVYILDADPTVAIYYSFGFVPTYTPGSYTGFSYGGIVTVGTTEPIIAIAVAANGRAISAAGRADYMITGIPASTPTVSVTSITVGGSNASAGVAVTSNAIGSVVTLGATGSIGGSFSPATCTIAAFNSSSTGGCTSVYTPSGSPAAGTYAKALTASFSATSSYSAATATGNIYVIGAGALTTLAPNDLGSTLIQASDGNFYGVDTGAGGIFKMDSSGNVTYIYNFTNGFSGPYPYDHLIEGTDGAFYGVTASGGSSGNGSIFKVDASGNFTQLYSFTGTIDGADIERALVQGTDGNFYGTAVKGGASGYGSAFKIDASGNFTLLHGFVPGEGRFPLGSLLQGADGNFYGTTGGGGTYGFGTVFKMDASGNVTTLHSFTSGAGGTEPYAGLVQGTDGSFYGTTFSGGAAHGGTIYKIDSSGNFTVLHGFSGAEGAEPESALVQAADGDFYGLASYPSSIFKVDASGNFTPLSLPGYLNTEGSLVQGSDGGFYGTSAYGIFRLSPSPALAGPVTLSVPASVTHASSFTLAYTVTNASSQTMQHCFATNTAGDVTGWAGIKTASTSATNATLTAPVTAGTYTYALTCGGVESGFAILKVN